KKTGINCEERKITNQAGRKTLVQRLKDIGTTDYEVSTITWHRSLSGIAHSSETVASDTQLSLPANTLPASNLYQGFKSARQIFQANLVSNMPSTLPKQRSQVPTSQLTNLSALSARKSSNIINLGSFSANNTNSKRPIIIEPGNSKTKTISKLKFETPLQPVSNNYVELKN
ncbi:14042_t:CDS:2, partial [Gigaspora margarita]